MNPLETFPWPKLPETESAPRWNGREFQVGGKGLRVLSYTAQESHWSNELTSLHEEEAGRTHPIDLASRQLALNSMAMITTDSPVILDVGCSSGYILEDLQKELPSASTIGADYLLAPLMGLANRMRNIPIMQFDLRSCPLPDQCIDGVTCLNVLEHIDDHESAMSEIYRILKTGGIAHIEVPSGPRLYDIYDEHLMHHRRYRMNKLASMLKNFGFTIIRKTHLGSLVFPPFAYIKWRNRKKLTWPPEQKKKFVAAQIRSTRSSFLLKNLICAEMKLGRFFQYPFGIRCVISLRKN